MEPGRAELQLTMRMVTEAATTKVPTRLRYDADDPYAVRLVFHSEGSYPVEWIFARELLAAGMTAACGDGDVRVWPAENGGSIFLELRSPTGQAVFAADSDGLEHFLARTQELVPLGAEAAATDMDQAMDQALELLLNGDPGIAPG